jgi:hypothetical protein
VVMSPNTRWGGAAWKEGGPRTKQIRGRGGPLQEASLGGKPERLRGVRGAHYLARQQGSGQ